MYYRLKIHHSVFVLGFQTPDDTLTHFVIINYLVTEKTNSVKNILNFWMGRAVFNETNNCAVFDLALFVQFSNPLFKEHGTYSTSRLCFVPS